MKNETPLSAKHPYESLKNAGYPKTLIHKFLPEWWDDSLLTTSAGVFQFANILQNKLGLCVRFAIDGELSVDAHHPLSRFKHRRDTKASELTISANIGRALGLIANHCARHEYIPLPKSASELRKAVLQSGKRDHVDFEGLLGFCWTSGIPVLFLDFLPAKAKRMAGMITHLTERPVIILGYKNEQRAKQLFVLAHELGHLQRGHIKANETLIDEDLDSLTEKMSADGKPQQDIEETEADQFALELLRGTHLDVIPMLGRPMSSTTLAANAMKLSKTAHIDPGHLILSFAYQTNDWITANKALGFIPKVNDALNVVKSQFLSNVDLEKLSEESRHHLLSMQNIADQR